MNSRCYAGGSASEFVVNVARKVIVDSGGLRVQELWTALALRAGRCAAAASGAFQAGPQGGALVAMMVVAPAVASVSAPSSSASFGHRTAGRGPCRGIGADPGGGVAARYR